MAQVLNNKLINITKDEPEINLHKHWNPVNGIIVCPKSDNGAVTGADRKNSALGISRRANGTP